MTPPFIRDLIDIPTQVQDGDFVLKLTQGVGAEARATVDQYVVTDQLAEAFDQALGLVASAVTDGQSKATFLQGSFGSGKSHFMAMLHLLLSHDTHARSKPQLHRAIDKWGTQLDGKRFLLVPVHFLDATSMEQKILGGYVERIQETDPDGGLPAVFLGDEIVATELPRNRELMGEDKFLEGLNGAGGAADADEWGDFAQAWATATVDEALTLPATDPKRAELVKAYIAAFRAGTTLEAASTGRGFLDLDRGLAAVSRHAKANGYDGIVLFLDELILWLASNIGNLDFVQAESQKLTKLVEATAAGRPVPIISFVARQRDLKELVGEHIVGAEMKSFADNLELQSGRFDRIPLTSGNLPVVAKQRLLDPVDDQAAAALTGALDQALGGREDVRNLLLGSDADLDLFRTVYPFSPALVNTLIDVSEALQRERTALKVMLQLLVDQRDALQLGQIIPVGDLWDVVAGRDEPFSNELKALFDTAKKLWRTKIHPALQQIHGIDEATPADAPQRLAYAADARLLKTILLAALVPENEALANLDARKLAALNWGSVTSPIAGNETQLVVSKLQKLVTHVGELSIGDDPVNPTVFIRLANVDTDDIVRRAVESYDNPGTRRLKIRRLIARALDGKLSDDLEGAYDHEWRGTVRKVDVVFGNIRDRIELADAALAQSADRPKLVIDFPFDDAGRSPEDDLERLDEWSSDHEPSNTVCWLPSFFHREGVAALREYVAIDELLKQDRFDQHTTHLSANQRLEARPILEARRNQLEGRLREAILTAYGVINRADDPFVDPANTLTDHYRTLHPALAVRPTTKPTFDGAMGELCDQIFDALYPGHPKFESKVTGAQLRHTWATIRRALADPDDRANNVETSHRRSVRNVANALELGTMHESHFILSGHWRTQLDRHLAGGDGADGAGVHTVADARAWIDDVPGGPRGLDPEVADLVILTVAAQTDHRLMDHGRVYDGDAGRPMSADIRIVPEELPPTEVWEQAVLRASEIFGETFSRRITGPELTSLGNRIRERATALRADAETLAGAMSDAYHTWGLGEGARLATALATRDLVQELVDADDKKVVELLARYQSPGSPQACSNSLITARSVSQALGRTNFGLLDTARSVVGADVDQLLTAEEVSHHFEQAELAIERRATDHIRAHTPAPAAADGPRQQPGAGDAPEAPVAEPPSTSATANTVTVASETDLDELRTTLAESLNEHGSITITWTPSPER